VGKSALARTALPDLADQFATGAFWISLSGLPQRHYDAANDPRADHSKSLA
jgi:hypothetical protein